MTSPPRQQFVDACVLLDLETTRDGRLRRIGAVLGEQTFERQGRFNVAVALADLDAFSAPAERLLGHNLLGHDLPFLDGLAPHLGLLRLPVVDTLYLSPLAFPKNPYHPLIKHHKDDTLLRQTENDPVADARLAAGVFAMEWDEFARLVGLGDPAPSVFRYCLGAATGRARGLADALAATGAPTLDFDGARDAIGRIAAPHVCSTALAALIGEFDARTVDLAPLAFCLSWLQVAGADSILPHWVRHQFTGVAPLVRRLRDVPCRDLACAYCSEVHDPVGQLRSYFGLDEFVARPAAPDGTSLQAAIARAGFADRALLALVPTGGGKSIGYQLPALARYRRRGALTVVVSPLQALMKDQVDGLNRRTQGHLAAALHGTLTPPERAEVLARVRLGDVALLYVSPEQLRNRSLRGALKNREIGCWVFDEAHCLSHWGHDFRPDYLYASRFIRELAEEQHVEAPPVACFTATAKLDVKKEILEHFRDGLGQTLDLFEAGVARENLHFEVHLVEAPQKLAAVAGLLRDGLGLDGGTQPPGAAIVYFATRSATEEAARRLSADGLPAEAFHAGLDPSIKQRVQDDFLAGAIPIICATNAFGMGIDKSDVRLVIHADVPSTLESYLQEAGRAGRDRGEARCVLLYAAPDVETQFRLLARSQLSRRDIAAILKGLKRARPRGQDEVVITTGDLLRDEEVDTSFDVDDRAADTKVKTGIAWLERAGLVERNENQTRVFQGRPRVKSLAEAEARMEAIRPPLVPAARQRWLALLSALMNSAPDEGLSADDLAQLPDVGPTLPERRSTDGETPGQAVLESLVAMVRHGLIEDGLLCTAYVRWKVTDSAARRFDRLATLDEALIDLLREQSPDAENGQWESLSLRRINQRLLDDGHDSDADAVRRLLKSLEWDGRGTREKMPPVLRLREVAALLDALHSLGAKAVDDGDLRALRSTIAAGHDDNPWLHLLDENIESWVAETAGAPQPARDFAEHLVESLIEQRREQTIGRGALISTIHGANLSVSPWELIDGRQFRAFADPTAFSAALRASLQHQIVDSDTAPLPGPLSSEKVEALIRYCHPVQNRRPGAREQIQRRDEEAAAALRAQQRPVLDLALLNPRLVISGGAGTGKTLIAMELARRAAQAGQRVGLLCFNRLVGDWLRREAERSAEQSPKLVAGRTIQVLAELSNVTIPAAPPRRYWDVELPEAIEARLTDPEFVATVKFDYLVVDEAQDLLARPALWHCVAQFLEGGITDGSFALFGDFDNQQLSDRTQCENTLAQIMAAGRPVRWNLSENCRNYRIVGETALRLAGLRNRVYEGYRRIGGGVPNFDISFYNDDAEQENLLVALLQQSKRDGYRDPEVTILSFCAPDHSVAARGPRLRASLLPAGAGSGRTTYTSVHAFKGLENKVIILTDLVVGGAEFQRNVFYTGMTRATESVRILCAVSSQPGLLRWLQAGEER